MTQTSGKSPRNVVYMIRLPSGENRGSASSSVPCVSCLASAPVARIVQTFMVPLRSLTKTIVPLRLASLIFPELGDGAIAEAGLVEGTSDILETTEVFGDSAATRFGLFPASALRARLKP